MSLSEEHLSDYQMNSLISLNQDKIRIFKTDELFEIYFSKEYGWTVYGSGSENLVYVTGDQQYVIKEANLENIRKRNARRKLRRDAGRDVKDETPAERAELRYQSHLLEIELPESNLLAVTVAISPTYTAEDNKGMNLLQKIHTTNAPDIRTRLKICRDMFEGIALMHSSGIVHLDLKPENVFIGSNNHKISIGDFGFAQHIGSNTTRLGTPEYYPNNSSPRKDQEVDIYAIALSSIQVLRWGEGGETCFIELLRAMRRSNSLEQVCHALNILLTGKCTEELKVVEEYAPGSVDALRCSILGKECGEITCDTNPKTTVNILNTIIATAKKEHGRSIFNLFRKK